MNTWEGKVTINIYGGKIVPIINDANNFKSCLDHEGGSLGHLKNPEKKHSDIYKDQIKKYSKTVTPDFLKVLKDNFKRYKNEEDENN